MSRYISRYGLVTIQLRRWQVSPREDALLPIAFDGCNRTFQYPFRKQASSLGVRALIDGSRELAVVPTGRALQIEIGQEGAADVGCRVARVNDDHEIRSRV